MIQCSRCKVQYIGETKRQLSDRFGEHRRAIEKAITHRHIDQPTAVSDHFTLPGHSINDIQLIPLELIHSNRDSIRKARETFLISKGKTLEPHGINRRDETLKSISIFIVAVRHVSAYYVCQPIIFNLFILIILNLVTVSFHFYLAFAAPDEGEFCLTEILGNKITLLSCPISLAIGFSLLRCRFARAQVATSQNVGCFFRLNFRS